MDLHRLQQFLVVAELEHIGKAAKRLHVSASPLSRAMRRLEEEIGATLFVRERQRVRLTVAGRALLARGRALMEHRERIAAEVRALDRGEAGHLTVGFVEGALHAGVLPAALKRFEREAPGPTVELRNLRTDAQLNALGADGLDLGLTHRPPPLASSLRSRLLVDEPFVLAVPKAHPMRRWSARRASAAPFIGLASSTSEHGQEEFAAACATIGFTPRVRCTLAEPSAVLCAVAAGVGIAIVQKSATHPGVRAIRLPPKFEPRLRVYVVLSATPSPLASRFADVLMA